MCYPCSRVITSLKDLRGEPTKGVQSKLEIFVDCFQCLYTPEEGDSKQKVEFLDSLKLPRLIEEHVALSEAPIGQGEIAEAIKAMKTNTAPDSDGFTLEFCKKFEDSLLMHLMDLFAACAAENKCPGSWVGQR